MREARGGAATGVLRERLRSLSPARLEKLLGSLARDEYACAFWESLTGGDWRDRLALVRQVGGREDPRARKLLAAALWDEAGEVALAAIESLRRQPDAQVAESLAWLAEITRRRPVAEAARSAAAEMAAQRGRWAVKRCEGESRAVSCWGSFIDGDGGQLLMAVRSQAAGTELVRVASVMLSDQRGIVDASGMEDATPAEAAELRNNAAGCSVEFPDSAGPGSKREESGSGEACRLAVTGATESAAAGAVGWVPVDPGYCAAALEAGRQVHRRDHRRLPGAWEFWRETFAVPRGTAGGDEAAAGVALEDRSLPEARVRRRLPQTASLIQFEGFGSWLIQLPDLAPFLPAMLRSLALDPPAREEELSRAISVCLTTVIGTRQRRLWRDRLLRQAALWDRRGDRVVSELCLAAAGGLDHRRGVPSEGHPLLRAMARASLEIILGREIGTNHEHRSSE